MRIACIFACLSSFALMACAVGDAGEAPEDALGSDRAGSGALDPLGVELEAVGLSAGDKPCGADAHVASIVDKERRYLAFCVSASGTTSVLQITPGSVAPIGAPSACALDTFLAASPEDTPVPRALVDACEGVAPRSRQLSDEPVVVDLSPSINPQLSGPGDFTALGPCQSTAVFTNVYCDAIDDYATDPQVADAVSWCRVGPFSGNAQRTASAQGLPDAFAGRQTVAACGTGTTNLRGYVKRGLSGTWAVPSGANVNISPNHVATREIHGYDVVEYDAWGTAYPGSDLRFVVTPSAGAWYRYTGAFIEYPPVP
jgi:hypothetical protein